MISIPIKNTKEFMSELLIRDMFDHFLALDISITTFNTFSIDGHIRREFYSDAEFAALEHKTISSWKSLKPQCFQIIKGNKTPLKFKMIFAASVSQREELLNQTGTDFTIDDIEGLYLNINYEHGRLNCITGTSFKAFSLDKSLESAWDTYINIHLSSFI